jgi:DNA-binding NarL/FixJ family response regulator
MKQKKGKPTLVIVDDHKILRDSLCYVLKDMDIVDVIDTASNGKEFLEIIDKTKPDIAIIDINMPVMNGVDATKKALEKYPDLKILILSMHGEGEFYQSMIELGVKGFIPKEADYNELQKAVETILNGGHYFSQELLVNIIKTKKKQLDTQLTNREKDVLQLICNGLSTNEIADKLFLSASTIEKHRSELLLKTGSSNAISLVIFAIRNKLIEI